jgi:DNA-binding transcriptional regulator LsrR (DeoR family)
MRKKNKDGRTPVGPSSSLTPDISKEPKTPPPTADMLKVARLFYKEGLTRDEIVKATRFHARRVRWLLSQARQLGIVHIDIFEPPGAEIESLEIQFRKRFPHLQEVKIIPGAEVETEADYAALLRQWGSEAAAYFDKLADTGRDLHVGITGSETWLEVTMALPQRIRPNVHVYAAALIGRGRLTMSDSHIDPLVNAALLWAKSGRLAGHCHYATVPPYDGTLTRDAIAQELDRLSKITPIRRVLEDMDEINVVFAGLGMVNPKREASFEHINRLTMTGLLRPMGITPQDLDREEAVGDLGYSMFDQNGRGKRGWQFFLTAGYNNPKRRGIEFYRQKVKTGQQVIVIAGAYKEPALYAALKAKLFNVLFTNEAAARKILEMSQD